MAVGKVDADWMVVKMFFGVGNSKRVQLKKLVQSPGLCALGG